MWRLDFSTRLSKSIACGFVVLLCLLSVDYTTHLGEHAEESPKNRWWFSRLSNRTEHAAEMALSSQAGSGSTKNALAMKRIAVYTVVSGGYEAALRTSAAALPVPCFVVSDDASLAKEGWQHVPLAGCEFPSDLPTGGGRLATWKQRSLKICPHLIPQLRPFDALLYIDGNIELTPAVIQKLQNQTSDTPDIVSVVHGERSSAREEISVVASRFPGCNVSKIEEAYDTSGFNAEEFGLSQTNVLWRSMPHSARMRQFAALWLATMELGPCWRDQLGFDYAAWQTGLSVKRVLEFERDTLPKRLRAKVDPFAKPLGFTYYDHAGKVLRPRKAPKEALIGPLKRVVSGLGSRIRKKFNTSY